MMRIIPLSLPSLVVIILIVNVYTSEANIGELTCTSPCQQMDASGGAGIALPPCIISTTRSCQTDVNVPANEAPGGPLQVGLDSSTYIGSDGKMYLDIAPHWQASPDRISLLTGYEVKVKCHRNICAAQYFCVTVLFNRTLTVDDTYSNFSVSCQYGDFAQPSMDYVTIIRSLPNDDDNTNEGRFIAALPSCEQEGSLSVCNIDSPENWMPEWRPTMIQIANGSVVVTFWPNVRFPIYVVMLEEEGGTNPNVYDRTFHIGLGLDIPTVPFNNVQEGTYKAYIMIDCYDCPMIGSKSSFTVKAMPTPAPSTTPPAPPTTSSAQPTPSPHPTAVSSSIQDPSLPLAAISGALGGILLVIVIVIFVACTCKWSPPAPSKSSGEEIEVGEDLTKSAMPHYNNIQYRDCDSLNGKSYINQWPLSNGNIYSDDPSCRFTSPSMVTPIIHNDNLINGRLMQESQFYADSMAYQQGDSVSKVAVDIHSSADPQTFSKGVEPESPDSGLELNFPDDMTDDGRTLFSLALTTMGDEV